MQPAVARVGMRSLPATQPIKVANYSDPTMDQALRLMIMSSLKPIRRDFDALHLITFSQKGVTGGISRHCGNDFGDKCYQGVICRAEA